MRPGHARTTPPSAAEQHGAPLTEALRREIDRVLRPILDSAPQPIVLLPFPNHPNVGDTAIWLGELAYLDGLGLSLPPGCSSASYSQRQLSRRLRRGSILITGGGNLGDLWEGVQLLRERVVNQFPKAKIVQLPQTICFRERANLRRTKAVFEHHPDFTLLCRDRASLELARAEFDVTSAACPDMAFALGPLERAAATTDILWLGRTDAEAADDVTNLCAPGVEKYDWHDPSSFSWKLRRRLVWEASLKNADHPRALAAAESALWRAYHHLGRKRMERGLRALSRGRVAVSDRLHGHILCELLGIPHVMFPDRYGKVRAFHETWTAASELATWADGPSEALAAASVLARREPSAALAASLEAAAAVS
jgi:exopolysaccharide biosynthesis predicted pyruvyltransferase EpsI